MKHFLFLIPVIFLVSYGCPPDNGRAANNDCNPNIALPELSRSAACRTLLVIAEDRSGSTADQRKLTEEAYRRVFQAFAQKASGVVAVRVIGNLAPEDRNFYRLTVDAPFDLLPVPEDATLSDKGLIRCQNKRIAAMNDSLAAAAQGRIGEFMETVNEKIIGYKPYQGRDATDVVDGLKHINTLVGEDTFSSFSKVIVLLVSDGVHSSSKEPLTAVFQPSRPVELFLIGWKDASIFNKLPTVRPFESVDGFIGWFQNWKCS